MRCTYRLLLVSIAWLSALLGATGCPGTAGDGLRRSISVGIGAPTAICPGADRIVTASTTTTIRRLIEGTSDVCQHHVSWHGPLLEPGQEASAALAPQAGRSVLILRQAQLVDELGAVVDGVELGAIEARVALEGRPVLAYARGGAALPVREPVPPELVQELRRLLEQGQPVMASVEVAFSVTPATRRALAQKTRGPQLALELSLRPE